MEPKTWTDEEIIELMVTQAREYKNDHFGPFSYRDMMECVLSLLKEHGLIEHTP